MTFFHFVNCIALAYAPYFIIYKYSGLSEYSSLWKLGQAAIGYLLTQLAKLLLLATFFPASDPSEGFAFVSELLKSSADIVDIVGLHLIIGYFMTGKSEVRFMTAGVGWAFANSIASRIVLFWVGARGTAFSWRYIQSAIDSSSDLAFWIAVACLSWLAGRENARRVRTYFLLIVAVFHTFIFQILSVYCGVGGWMMVVFRVVYSILLGFGAIAAYSQVGQVQMKRD
ncbi:unnamed protein product, partial [Mesorhabditis belari]|uniref:BOS complex subunit TMEM147 n=1 Tax=Mesorhabditis belari TaxID=2138241 RepID=A0AAF3J1Z0_9BILA